METRPTQHRMTQGLNRRQLLQTGLAAGATLAAWPLYHPAASWGAEAGPPKRGGILRARGWDPPHFDPHLTRAFMTHTALSFVYNKLLRHKVGPDVQPGTFIVEPDLAERWEAPDDTTYIFHLRQGVKWHNKPPVNGRELVAEDVKFSFDRFLTVPGNPERQLLESVDRVEVVDRYTVKFVLKEPFVWLLDILANAMCMWIVAPEVAQKSGDFKKVETAIGTGPFLLESYEPNVKTIFKRNPDYFRQGLPYVDGVEWLVVPDESTGLAMYRTGQLDTGPGATGLCGKKTWRRSRRVIPTCATRICWPSIRQPSGCARISRPSTMCGCGAPSRRRSIARRSSRRSTCGVSRARRSAVAWPSGRCPSTSSAKARYYQYNPKEARRLLAEAGYAKGFENAAHGLQWLWPRPDRGNAVSAALSQRCRH